MEILPPQWGGTNMQFMEDIGHDRTGICMGGEVPLYYQSVQQPQEIPGGAWPDTEEIMSNLTHRYGRHQHPHHRLQISVHPEVHHEAEM